MPILLLTTLPAAFETYSTCESDSDLYLHWKIATQRRMPVLRISAIVGTRQSILKGSLIVPQAHPGTGSSGCHTSELVGPSESCTAEICCLQAGFTRFSSVTLSLDRRLRWWQGLPLPSSSTVNV